MSRREVAWCGLAIVAAAQAVHAGPLLRPYLYSDDWAILTQSWTPADVANNLWLPMNEHCWPLTRLAAHAVVRLAGGPAGVPLAAALFTRLLLVGVVVLAGRFVARERGEPFPGLVAAAVVGVTAVYQEAVFWFAAGPGLAAAATGLLALLAAQRFCRTGRTSALLAAAGWSALAPGWFAGGLLAGPLAVLYLQLGLKQSWRTRTVCLLPLLGTAAFLLVSLPRAGDRILHAEHYGGKTAVEAFDPVTGAVSTARTLVDNLLLGAVGVSGVTSPPAAVVVGLLLLGGVWGWAWRHAPCRRLVLLGTAMGLMSYLSIYSARAGWDYDPILRRWSRYHVAPQLGLALAVAGSLPIGPPRRAGLVVGGLVVGLLLLHLPRGWTGGPDLDPEQAVVLRRVEAADGICRRDGIAAADVVAALPPLPVPGGSGENAWKLLAGSATPRPLAAAEVRRLLADVTEYPGPQP